MDRTKAVPGNDGEAELGQAIERFKQWRRERRRGEHVPPALWAQAVSLSARHGAHRVAVMLGLNAGRLLRRMRDAGNPSIEDEEAEPAPASAPQFVQMVVAPPEGETAVAPEQVPAVPPPACVLELHNAHGATLRMELPAQALSILPGLCAAFGGA